jgi:hypothetical protein
MSGKIIKDTASYIKSIESIRTKSKKSQLLFMKEMVIEEIEEEERSLYYTSS